MAILLQKFADFGEWYGSKWELRDKRMDGYPLLGSPIPTFLICAAYVYLVKVAGPKFMRDRKPMNLKTFLVLYNSFQVIISAFLVLQMLKAGWAGDYSFRCQPMDYSDNPKAVLMSQCAYLYYLLKFLDFIDTFCFVAKKKFSHVSLLHVVHHGLMPMSVWLGLRWVPGGHATFFGFMNTIVHFFMYIYYLMAALGPAYQKFIWWKRHMTNMQMVQFVLIFVHGVQLLFYDDCDFPKEFGYFIAAHALLFFILFSQFYVTEYLRKDKRKAAPKSAEGTNGHAVSNGDSHHGLCKEDKKSN